MKNSTDVLVIGGGAIGTSCAYWLSRQGRSVTLLEQSDIPNSNASSGDHLKSLRLNFQEDAFYTELALKARVLWLELNSQWSEKLFEPSGVLELISSGAKEIERLCAQAKEKHLKIIKMDRQELSRNYPTLNLRALSGGILYPEAGIIRAARSVTAFSSLAQKRGAKIHPRTRIVSLIKENNMLAGVKDERGQVFKASSYVFALGPWTSKLLGTRFPLKVTRQFQLYLKPPTNSGRYLIDHFPVMIHPDHFYIYPLHIRGYLKIADHKKGTATPLPKEETSKIPPALEASFQKRCRLFLKKSIPELVGFRECETSSGFCDRTKNGDFILDRIPGASNALVAAGFADYGLQFAPLIGKALADLSVGGKPDWNLQRFRLKS